MKIQKPKASRGFVLVGGRTIKEPTGKGKGGFMAEKFNMRRF